MLYFSAIYGKKVFSKNGRNVGKLVDLLFLPLEIPIITKFIVRQKNNKEVILPIHLLKNNGNKLFIKDSEYKVEVKLKKEASVLRNIQDKQIIDLRGQKVIRANDVVIQVKPSYAIAGIDIGVLGVFRWIGAATFIAKILRRLSIQYKSEYLPWNEIQPIEVSQGKIVLKHEKEKMEKLQPEDLADYVERTTIVNAIKVLKLMDEEFAADVIADINLNSQTELFKQFSSDQAGRIISLIDPDEAVDILLTLNEEKRNEILLYVKVEKKQSIIYLLQHAKTPIGHLMTTHFLTVYADFTVKKAMDKIKTETSDFENLSYVYVKNKQDQIVGVVSLHELLLQDLETQLYKFMIQNLVIARLTTPKEIVIKKLLKYHLQSLPIINDERGILGVVNLEDIAETMLDDVIDL